MLQLVDVKYMYPKYIKRVLDISFALVFGILLIPLMLLICLISSFYYGTGVFFVQKRVGYQGKIFHLVKFKTMKDKKRGKGRDFSDQSRETKFGRFLRRTSLDELPQLYNILKGDMALIGPRPLMKKYVRKCTPWQEQRHSVLPGITGLAQVCGRNSISYRHRFRYDVLYVQHLSFRLDCMILLKTVGVVLSRKGTQYDSDIEEIVLKPKA